MKRLILTTLLSLACVAANAEWVFVASEAVSGNRYYADPTTKRRAGNVVRMWELSDNVKPEVIGGKVYLSSRIFGQYDCSERTHQILQLGFFAGKMLTGELGVADNQPSDKIFVAPGTTGEIMLNFACK